MRTRLLAIVASCALLAAVFVTASPAGAQTTDVFCPPADASDLQAAIDAADPGDTIRVAGRCEGTIVVRTGDNIRLLGYGPFATLDGVGAGTVVTVEEGAELLAADLTITGGSTSATATGGGMTVAGAAELVNVNVIHNEATTDSGTAGGIRLSGAGGASVQGSGGTISYNTATQTDGGGAAAGAVYMTAGQRLELYGTSIIGNQATGNSAGGIRTSVDSVVALDDVQILGNVATGDLAAGGIYATVRVEMTVTDSLIAFNRVEADGSDNAGGMRLAVDTTATIESTTVAFNSVTNTNLATRDTGGIYLTVRSTLDGSDLTVMANRGGEVGGLLSRVDASVDVASSVVVLNRSEPGGTGGVLAETDSGQVNVGLVALNTPGQCSGAVTGTCLF